MNSRDLLDRDWRWTHLAWVTYAVVIFVWLVRTMLDANGAPTGASAAPVFNVSAPLPTTVDAHAMSRGSLAHDGVDHQTTLAPPLKLAWQKIVNTGVIGGGLAEPTVDESGVYVGADTGWLHALNLDGSRRWAYLDANAQGGITGAPATDSKTIYFGTSAGNLVALEKTTGHVSWVHRFEGQIAAAPVLIDQSVLFTVSSGRGSAFVIKVRRGDGAVEWISDRIEANSSSGPTVDRVTNLVFTGAADRRVHAFGLATGHRAWSRELDADVQATPVLVGGHLFVITAGEFVYALKATDGDAVWKSLVRGGSRASLTWEPSTNIMVVGTSRGLIYGFDRVTGKPRWIDRTDTIFNGLAGGTAVRRSAADAASRLIWITCADTVVCALDPRGGTIVEKIATLGPVASSPVAHGHALYVVESTGALRKYVSRRP